MINFIVLAGGFGTRLHTISKGTPKAMMPISNSLLFLDLLLEKVFKYDNFNIYLSLYYKPHLFQDYIQNSIYRGRITPVIEPKPLGTGGAINFIVENFSITSPFIVINGDSLSNIKVDQMYKKFNDLDVKAVLGISEVKNTSRYGTIIEKDGRIISFKEKRYTGLGWINNGHYLFTKEAFDGFYGTFSLEKELFPKLIKEHELGAFKVINDNFIDIGIPEDYEKLCDMYAVEK